MTTIESHEVVTFTSIYRIACPHCGNALQMLTPAEAASQRNVSQLVVYRWIEAGLIHFAETDDGGLFVCLASLTNALIEIPTEMEGTQQ